jgi:hypothetical protein
LEGVSAGVEGEAAELVVKMEADQDVKRRIGELPFKVLLGCDNKQLAVARLRAQRHSSPPGQWHLSVT